MKVTNRLTTDFITMYINIPTEEGMEHYVVNILHPDMNKDIYSVTIYDLDTDGQDLYGQFKINKFYGVLNGYELDKREYLILNFMTDRLRLK